MSEASTALAVVDDAYTSLPSLVDRARQVLTEAKTAAEVLEAKEMASVGFDIAKMQTRLAKAKKAHDDVISSLYRSQANFLEIEARAKMRLADEYDAAQARGEIAKPGKPLRQGGLPTVADAGLTHNGVYEARQLRDAENKEPGFIKRTLDEAIADGKEPSRPILAAATTAVVKRAKITAVDAVAIAERLSNGEKAADIGKDYGLDARSVALAVGNAHNTNNQFHVPDGATVESQVRKGMALEIDGATAEEAAKIAGIGILSYRRVRELIVLIDEIPLNPKDHAIVVAALADINATKRLHAHDTVAPIIARVWGNNQYHTAEAARKRADQINTVVGQAVLISESLSAFDMPSVPHDTYRKWVKELRAAQRSIGAVIKRMEEEYD